MKSQNNSSTLKAIIIILILVVAGLAVYAYDKTSVSYPAAGGTSTATSTPAITATTTPVATTTSTITGLSDWQTLSSSTTGVTFEYPVQLGTNYIQTAEWPPTISVSDTAYNCASAGTGSEIEPTGKTSEITENGNTYCMTIESEGAAGSIYDQYAYAFSKDGKTMTLNFTLRMPQCENYDEPQVTQCKAEEASFDVNSLADGMAQSVKYVAPPGTKSPPPSNITQIDSISPDSTTAGTNISIMGSGFLSSNKVLFDGDVAAANVKPSISVAGYETLIIPVPTGIGPDCKANQACPAYERLVTPGSYFVSVENDNGTSNVLSFIVEQGQ